MYINLYCNGTAGFNLLLEAAKGKIMVVVGEKRRLLSVIQSLIGAIEACELDSQLSAIKRVDKK